MQKDRVLYYDVLNIMACIAVIIAAVKKDTIG